LVEGQEKQKSPQANKLVCLRAITHGATSIGSLDRLSTIVLCNGSSRKKPTDFSLSTQKSISEASIC
jgi:hypothetical protein